MSEAIFRRFYRLLYDLWSNGDDRRRCPVCGRYIGWDSSIPQHADDCELNLTIVEYKESLK